MKLTAFVLVLGLIHVSAATLAQKVTLHASNEKLSVVLDAIRMQTGYDFAYTSQALDAAKPVTIDVTKKELKDVLDQIFDRQNLDYSIENKFVTVSVKQPTILDKIKSALNLDKIEVHGQVIGDNNLPLAGATVTVKGTTNATNTDDYGRFTLKGVEPATTIVITYIGYDKKELAATAELGAIKLILSQSPLDEVKVIAYGNTTERLTVGNVSTVSGKDIHEQPVDNPLAALEGKVPGLFITQGSGVSGSGYTVRIQGQNSISDGNDPLYVIDGVPYTSQTLGTITGNNKTILSNSGSPFPTDGAGNPMNFINPNDIESISILKDADATAIYGSRAANGAILITTKKGKAGQTKVDARVQNGWGSVTRTLPMMNTQQYLAMRREAYSEDGLPVPSITTSPNDNNYDINGLWDQSRSTDWEKSLIGNTAQYQDAYTEVSGGSPTIQYLVSGTFHRQTSVFPGVFDDKKGGLHFSLNTSSVNQRFKMQLTGSYLLDDNRLPTTDLTLTALLLPPDAPTVRNPDGSLNWAPNASGFDSFLNNPLAYENTTYENKTNNLVSNLQLSYNLLPGLDIRSSFGYTDLKQNEFYTIPFSAIAPFIQPFSIRSANFDEADINSWLIEPQAEYKKQLSKKLKMDALIGGTLMQKNSNGQNLTASGQSSDVVLSDIASANSVTVNQAIVSDYKYVALFGRLNLNWDDRYLLNLTANQDGSSRFGPDNEYHGFWSAGAGWIFSEMSVVKNNLSFLSFGKLKGSYGTTGSDQIGDYTYLNLYNPISANIAPAYQGITAYSPIGLANPHLQWELTRKLQLGIDLGFLKDRILLNVSWVHNRSSNELLNEPLPIIDGFAGIEENLPATVQNDAWELTLNTTNIKSKNFSWTTAFNFTAPKNKLISFPGLASSPYAADLVIGQPLDIQHAFHYLGVDPQNGDYLFADSQGKPTDNPDYNADRTAIVNIDPKFYGGIQNTFAYKHFRLDISFQFVKQTGMPGTNLDYGVPFGGQPGTKNQNEPAFLLGQEWKTAGDIATVQRLSSTFNYYFPFADISSSDAGATDASYIRLRNLALSWDIPQKWQKCLGMQNGRLFLNGQNLLTITKFKGLDPENQSISSLPPLKVLSAGLDLGF